MGTIKKQIMIDDEDILNLNNAKEVLMKDSEHRDFVCEVLTLDSIIKRWNEEVVDEKICFDRVDGSNKSPAV